MRKTPNFASRPPSSIGSIPSLRRRLFHILHKPTPDNLAARYANYVLAFLIIANCAAVALETIPELYASYATGFVILEAISTAIFTVEYVLRLWVCVEQQRLARPIAGRIRYMFQPLPLLDLIVITTYLAPVDLRFLRIFRMVRLLRVLRLGDYEASLEAVSTAIARRRSMLVVAVTMMMIAVYCSAAVLYQIEKQAQPDVFRSIPATLWWAVETLTTIGYGDMYPITPFGKFCASILAVFGVGVFALPTAILTAAILDATQHNPEQHACPHCGKHADDKVKPDALVE